MDSLSRRGGVSAPDTRRAPTPIGDHSALASALLLLGAAFGAIFLTGAREQGSLGLFLIVAGAALILFKPQVQLSRRLWMLAGTFLGAAALSLLPLAWIAPPEWRVAWQAAPEIPASSTITPVPLETVWWWSLLAVSVGVGFFVLSRPLRSRGQLALANTAVCLTAFYAALAILSDLTGWRFPFDVQPTFGFFRNRNHTASFLVVGALLALGVLGLSSKRGHTASRILAAAGVALCSIALIFFSTSRAGVVFLGLGTILWLLGLGRSHRTQTHFLAIAGLVLLGLLVFLLSGGPARERLFGLVGLQEGVRVSAPVESSEEPIDFRLLIFQDTWRIIQDHPWSGTGLGTFAAVFPQYQEASLRAATAAHPESDWLMLAAEAGLPCVVLLVLLVAVTSWSLRHFRGHPYWPLRWGMFCAAATAALHGLIDVPAHRIPLGWWILLLGAASLRPATSFVRSHWTQRVVFLVAGGGALFLGGSLIRAEWFSGATPAPFSGLKTQHRVAEYAATNRVEEAIEAAESGIDRTPLSDGLYYQLGCLLLTDDDTQEDAATLFAAQRLLQPRWPEIAVRQGLAWLQVDLARTVPLWKDALARQRAIDSRTQEKGASSLYVRLLREAQETPVQSELLDTQADLSLLWIWLETVPPPTLDEGLERLADDPSFLEKLEPSDRLHLIQIWARRGELGPLQQFVEENADWGAYVWPLRLREALDARDFEAAVRLMCKEFAISLALPERKPAKAAPERGPSTPPATFESLWMLGREISARALLAEAAQGERIPPEVQRWRAALAAHDGQWPEAWEYLQKYLRVTKGNLW